MTIDIKYFYDPNDITDVKSHPHTIDGMTVVTDGYAMLVTPMEGDYPQPTNVKLQTGVRNIIEQLEGRKFISIPDIELPKTFSCGRCEGTGKATETTCGECAGDGVIQFSNDRNTYDSTCKSCHGDGKITQRNVGLCQKCKGIGTIFPGDKMVNINGLVINPKYLRFIYNEPGVLISVDLVKLMLYFKCGDDRGVIMGIKP